MSKPNMNELSETELETVRGGNVRYWNMGNNEAWSKRNSGPPKPQEPSGPFLGDFEGGQQRQRGRIY